LGIVILILYIKYLETLVHIHHQNVS